MAAKEKKIQKEAVLITLDCVDKKSFDFTVPINLKMSKADGFAVSQICSAISTNYYTVYSISSNLVGDETLGIIGNDRSSGLNSAFDFPGGKQIRGNYRFKVSDLLTSPSAGHYPIIGIMLQFFCYV